MFPILLNVAANVASNVIDALSEKIRPHGPVSPDQGVPPTSFADEIASAAKSGLTSIIPGTHPAAGMLPTATTSGPATAAFVGPQPL